MRSACQAVERKFAVLDHGGGVEAPICVSVPDDVISCFLMRGNGRSLIVEQEGSAVQAWRHFYCMPATYLHRAPTEPSLNLVGRTSRLLILIECYVRSLQATYNQQAVMSVCRWPVVGNFPPVSDCQTGTCCTIVHVQPLQRTTERLPVTQKDKKHPRDDACPLQPYHNTMFQCLRWSISIVASYATGHADARSERYTVVADAQVQLSHPGVRWAVHTAFWVCPKSQLLGLAPAVFGHLT